MSISPDAEFTGMYEDYKDIDINDVEAIRASLTKIALMMKKSPQVWKERIDRIIDADLPTAFEDNICLTPTEYLRVNDICNNDESYEYDISSSLIWRKMRADDTRRYHKLRTERNTALVARNTSNKPVYGPEVPVPVRDIEKEQGSDA